ncbi:adenylyltransferase and sulfurtransferase MOCS3-like [Ctenocephalides felis]|uniref:adenylyltransferase and sulfurtransferase MOCS3-like n=1 Tax=Ctenocephalides felis TaxID=7515 RepID=UPI000E6E2199|nr:adenylyltransferase and sulfurtransferase MOCS3-like [Ctenocephalides felis]
MDKDPKLKILSNDERVTVIDFNNKQKTTESKHVLIDVRATSEFEMCKIQKSINIPIDDVLQNKQTDLLNNLLNNNDEVYVVCRRGNDSQRAVKHLKETLDVKIPLYDLVGGLHAWAADVDTSFPIY